MTGELPSVGKRPRFSLLTLLLLTTIVALAVSLAILYRDFLPLQAEVARLRKELGELRVDDPSKLQAIRVETDNELEWKWRVWIPEGTVYRVRSHGDYSLPRGYPQGGGTVYLREAGEHVLRYVIRRDSRDDRWYGTMQAGPTGVGKDLQSWVQWKNYSSTSSGVGTVTETFDLKQPVEIFRLCVTQEKDAAAKGGSGSETGVAERNEAATDDNRTDGFMIWLEPE